MSSKSHTRDPLVILQKAAVKISKIYSELESALSSPQDIRLKEILEIRESTRSLDQLLNGVIKKFESIHSPNSPNTMHS